MATVIYGLSAISATSRPGPFLENSDIGTMVLVGVDAPVCPRSHERCALAKRAKLIQDEMARIHWELWNSRSQPYRRVAPKRISTVRVNCVFRGHLKPRRFSLGENEE